MTHLTSLFINPYMHTRIRGGVKAWLTGWDYRKPIVLTGGASGTQTNYQQLLYITSMPNMEIDFDDLRFTLNDGETLIDSWLKSKIDSTSAFVWVEFPTTPDNTLNQTYYMYYGNSVVSNVWDGAATFIQYHGTTAADFDDSYVAPSSSVYEVRAKPTSVDANVHFGMSNDSARADDEQVILFKPATNTRGLATRNEGAETYISEILAINVNQWYEGKIINNGSNVHGYWDNNEIMSGNSTNIPDETLGMRFHVFAGSAVHEWSFVRKYVANPPTYVFGSEESY